MIEDAEEESGAPARSAEPLAKLAPAQEPGAGLRMKNALEVYAQQQAMLRERLASISSSLKVNKWLHETWMLHESMLRLQHQF
jgi:hypothetical protein